MRSLLIVILVLFAFYGCSFTKQNPLLQKPKDLLGSGHHCIFTDKQGQLRLAFHAHKDKENIHPREMYITNVDFEEQNGIDVLTIDSNYRIPVLKK